MWHQTVTALVSWMFLDEALLLPSIPTHKWEPRSFASSLPFLFFLMCQLFSITGMNVCPWNHCLLTRWQPQRREKVWSNYSTGGKGITKRVMKRKNKKWKTMWKTGSVQTLVDTRVNILTDCIWLWLLDSFTGVTGLDWNTGNTRWVSAHTLPPLAHRGLFFTVEKRQENQHIIK